MSQMLTQCFVFQIAAVFKIGNSKELPPIPDHLSEEGRDFIRQCLQRDPSSRPTAVDLLQHSFIRNASPLEKSLSDPLLQLSTTSCKPDLKVSTAFLEHVVFQLNICHACLPSQQLYALILQIIYFIFYLVSFHLLLSGCCS